MKYPALTPTVVISRRVNVSKSSHKVTSYQRSCSELVEACKLQLCALSYSEVTTSLTQWLTIRAIQEKYAQTVSKISSATLHCFNPDIYKEL